MIENHISGTLQEEFIAEGFRLYLKNNRKVPSNDILEQVYYILLYTQKLDELTRTVFLAESLLPENIINQYKNDINIQEALNEAKEALKSVINDDKKLIRERWQNALKKAWERLPHEKREDWRQKITRSSQATILKSTNVEKTHKL